MEAFKSTFSLKYFQICKEHRSNLSKFKHKIFEKISLLKYDLPALLARFGIKFTCFKIRFLNK